MNGCGDYIVFMTLNGRSNEYEFHFCSSLSFVVKYRDITYSFKRKVLFYRFFNDHQDAMGFKLLLVNLSSSSIRYFINKSNPLLLDLGSTLEGLVRVP